MKRHYYLQDARGKRKLEDTELPLRIGGGAAANIVVPGLNADQLRAFFALEKGHAYIQHVNGGAACAPVDIFLNDEQIDSSCWLKSGDRIQINEHVLRWTVTGDKVVIDLLQPAESHPLHPPLDSPPASAPPVNNELPVNTQRAPGSRSHRGARKLALGLLSLLLLAVIYLLMLIPLSIEIEPEADQLSFSGFPPPVKLWGSHLVMPGTYRLEAQREGYLLLDTEIDIDRNSDTALHFKLEELPGRLEIKLEPDVSYKLFVGDRETAGDEHGQFQLPRGEHEIRVKTERYLPHRETVEIKGFGQTQQLQLALQPAWASVSISSQPENAELFLDGTLMGHTPLDTEIMQGNHSLEFRLAGFKSLTLDHNFAAGETLELEPAQLEPLDGELSLKSKPPGASVTVDGRYAGITPLKRPLSAGAPHELRLSKAGFHTVEQQVRVQPEEVLELNIPLKPEYGTLFLSVRPTDARISIDGKPVQVQGGRLRLAVRTHTLTVSKPGYHDHVQQVTPGNLTAQHLQVTLKPAQEADAGATNKAEAIDKTEPGDTRPPPRQITTKDGQSLQLVEPQSSFLMGASRREAGRRANENRRQVRLERPFYFAHRETTNQAYRMFDSSHDSGSLDGAGLNEDLQPVVNVSWDNAARYCNWLSRQQGLPEAYEEVNGTMIARQPMNTGYRLPTEAEWAWVARRHEQEVEQRYPWEGSYPPSTPAGNYADARIADTLADVVPGYDDGYRGTAPVGQFPDRPRGFFDLGGNAAEWVSDYYALYPGQSTREVVDPQGPATGSHHSIRGSGWRHGNITELRLSYRDYSNKARPDLGFRIARYAR